MYVGIEEEVSSKWTKFGCSQNGGGWCKLERILQAGLNCLTRGVKKPTIPRRKKLSPQHRTKFIIHNTAITNIPQKGRVFPFPPKRLPCHETDEIKRFVYPHRVAPAKTHTNLGPVQIESAQSSGIEIKSLVMAPRNGRHSPPTHGKIPQVTNSHIASSNSMGGEHSAPRSEPPTGQTQAPCLKCPSPTVGTK